MTAILDGILARPMGRGAGSWPLLQQANKPLYQILGEMLVLFRPRLNSREDVSFVANSETAATHPAASRRGIRGVAA